MSWKDKGKAVSKVIDKVLKEYKKISEAPTDLKLHEVIQERERRYKAIDGDGDIYLVANPAAWKETVDAHGRTSRHRPEPQLVMKASEAATSSKEVSLIDHSTNLPSQSGRVKF